MAVQADIAAMRARRAVRREQVRRRVVELIFLVYWLLIFEGALRKWAFPQLELVLFFVRVPVVLAIYAFALGHRLWPRPSPPLAVGYLFAAIALLWIPIQMMSVEYESLPMLLLAGYGWHNYFFYIPLAFLMAEQLRVDDLRRLVRQTFWIALPTALLVVLQFYSPPSAIVNQGAALDEEHQFQSFAVALGYIRPSGFFTSSGGQAQFVITLTAMLLANWTLPRGQRWVGQWLLLAATAAAAVMIALSGSRGLFVFVGLLMLTAVAVGFVTGRGRVVARTVFWPAALVVAFVVVWPLAFPTSFEVFMTRWESAQGGESQRFTYGIFGRALYGLYEFTDYLSEVPLTGYLLGMGGNAASRLAWLPDAAVLVEGGLGRHIIELGPVLGVAFIIFRVWIAGWLGTRVLRATHRLGDPLPLLLFGYVGVSILTAQITGAGVLQGYTWLFFGFCLAATRLGTGLDGRMLKK